MKHKVNEFGEVRLMLDMPDTVYNHLLYMDVLNQIIR